jgi:hypothetical protein
MADLQEALNAHDRVRKSTDLPLFFGRKDKDTVPPNLLLDRINRAATVAQWNTDERKITEFYLTLRDRAILWWDTLDDNPDVNKGSWAHIQREFLAAYSPRFTARTTCTNFQDLVQRNNENVHDYYLRVSDAFKKMCEAKPAAIATVRADRGTATAEQAAAIKLEGVKDSEGFFKHQLFIAGLKEDIRTKIMEAGKPSIQESVAHARELEVIHEDRKKGSTVGNIAENEDNDNLDDEERAAVDAIRLQRGRPPFGRPGQSSGQNQQPRPGNPRQGQQQQQPFNGDCRYCKFKGHHQKDCRKRKAAKAPMVDGNGKPYANQLASVAPPQQQDNNAGAASITSVPSDPYHLKW